MPLGERPAGAGLEVLLESDGAIFSRELQRDSQPPGAMWSRKGRTSGVVGFETTADVVGNPDIRATGPFASKDIDESLCVLVHGGPGSKELANAIEWNPE